MMMNQISHLSHDDEHDLEGNHEHETREEVEGGMRGIQQEKNSQKRISLLSVRGQVMGHL
jgi:hypothetical protein